MKILDVLFPRRCVGCGSRGGYFCSACRSLLRSIRSNEAVCPICEKQAIDGATHPGCRTRYTIDGLTSFFRYDGAVRKAIKAIKYRFVTDLAAEFVSLIPPFSLQQITTVQTNQRTALVPIPLHPSRLRERGYNQAEVLGALIAQKMRIPMSTDILRRSRKTIPQVAMKKREARLKNMEGVFAVFPNISVSVYPCIVLFDDVFTTGATMRAAANILKRSGAPFVWGVTMAR